MWWDEKFIYLEQRVITLSDNIVRTVGMVKLAIPNVDLEKLAVALFPEIKKPEMPEQLVKWIESNAISSQSMKKIE
jgi:hypothetical protein